MDVVFDLIFNLFIKVCLFIYLKKHKKKILSFRVSFPNFWNLKKLIENLFSTSKYINIKITFFFKNNINIFQRINLINFLFLNK